MIFIEPTEGVDIGAKAEIYAEMRRLAAAGVASSSPRPTCLRSNRWRIASSPSPISGPAPNLRGTHFRKAPSSPPFQEPNHARTDKGRCGLAADTVLGPIRREHLQRYSTLVVLILMFAVFALAVDKFLTSQNH